MIRFRPSLFPLLLVLIPTLAGVACGSSNPASPSAAIAFGVTLTGTVMGSAGSSSVGASSNGSASLSALTVTVQEAPAITTTVGADGSFTLRGLPEGSFTLVFSSGTTTFGSMLFSGVGPNQQITITVELNGNSIVLLEQRRNGIGHGDVEIEGSVDLVMALDPVGESRFVIDGYTVVARPGATAIRQGNTARTVADVLPGRRVHVKGSWLPIEGATQPVLALEIKLQDPSTDDDGDDDNGVQSFCPDAGKKAEVEGKITAKGASDVTVAQTGKGNFVAQVDSATRIRKGNKTYTFEQLAVGNRVHVKGTSLGLSGQTCPVDASEIKLQG